MAPHYKWQYDWQNTNIEKKSMHMRASLEICCIYLF